MSNQNDAQEVKPEPIVRTVRVTIEKEIRITLPASDADPKYIAWWSRYLWDIESVDDIAKFAASMAAQHGGGKVFDGIGLLSQSYSTYPGVPDTKFDELSSFVETEIIENAPEEKTAVQS